MMNRKFSRTTLAGLSIAGLAVCGVTLSGCSEPPPPPPPVVQKPTAPPPPPVTPISQLMAEMNIDTRIDLPEDRAPQTDAQRRAVLSFVNAFVKNDTTGLKTMLDDEDQQMLTALMQNGDWKSTVEGIERVDVRTQSGAGPLGQLAVMAVFWVNNGTLQPTMWYLNESGATSNFESAVAPPNILDRISGDTLIAEWHRIIELEKELADAPDEELKMQQIFLDEADTQENRDRNQPGGPTPPGGPGGPQPPAPGGPAPGPGGPSGPSPGGAPI
jgi:hypothetical protein